MRARAEEVDHAAAELHTSRRLSLRRRQRGHCAAVRDGVVHELLR